MTDSIQDMSPGELRALAAAQKATIEALEAEKARGFLPDGFAAVPIEQLTGMMSHNDHDTRVQAERHLLAALDTTPAPAAPDVAGLVKALEALCACIMETRGPSAHAALEHARTAIATFHGEG